MEWPWLGPGTVQVVVQIWLFRAAHGLSQALQFHTGSESFSFPLEKLAPRKTGPQCPEEPLGGGEIVPEIKLSASQDHDHHPTDEETEAQGKAAPCLAFNSL